MLAKVIAKIQLLLEEAQKKLSEDSVAVIKQVYSDVVKLDKFLRKKAADIEKDESLDSIKKRAAKREVFERAQRKLEALKAKRNYPTLIEKIELKLSDVDDQSEKEQDPVLKFLQEREIRDRLTGMTEAQILSLYGDSLFEGGNDLLLDAILDAPAGFEILSEDILSSLRLIKAKRLNPDLKEQIDTVQDFKSKTMHIFTLIKEELDNLRIKELPDSFTPKA